MFTHKNILWIGLGIITAALVAAILPLPYLDVAHAQPISFGNKSMEKLSETTSAMAMFLNFILFFVFIFLKILSILIEPTTIYEINQAAGGGSGLLLTMWQLSRDLMNMIFAFLLVFAALSIIINPGGYDGVKSNAAKFIIGVILVNFSWFFPRVILDTANVLTATVYSLPSLINVDCKVKDASGTFQKCKVITKVVVNPEEPPIPVPPLAVPPSPKYCSGGMALDITDNICIEYAEFDQTNTSLGVLHGLYVNFSRLLYLPTMVSKFDPTISTGLSKDVGVLLRFATQLAAVLLYAVAIFFPMLALTAAYLVRIPIIWLTICFMPFMFLSFVGLPLGNFDTMEKIFKRFLHAAFMPFYTAIPLAVGYVMINAGLQSACPAGSELLKPLCTAGGEVTLFAGINTFWELLWIFIAAAVMYKGFFAALKVGGDFESIANKVEGWGNTFGQFAMKAPLAMPIAPMPGGGGQKMSLLSMGKLATNPEATFIGKDGVLNLSKEDFMESLGKKSGGGGGNKGGTSPLSIDPKSINRIGDILKNNARPGGPAFDAQKIADAIKNELPKNHQNKQTAERIIMDNNLGSGFSNSKIQEILNKI